MLKAEQVPETVAHVAEVAWSKDATWQQIIAAAIGTILTFALAACVSLFAWLIWALLT